MRKFLLLFIIIFFLNNCAFYFIGKTKPLKETVISGKGKNKILLIDISGIISTKKRHKFFFLKEESIVSRIKEELKKANSDKKIKGIVLRINSPGGTVTASDIIYHEIKKFKQKRHIPVVAYMMDIATSGAYYISLAADIIMAHPTSITGGIGVIALKFNIEELLKKIGIKDESIKSGKKKDLWSPFRPCTEEERKILQEIINELHERFIKTIAENRKMLTIGQIKKLADGRIYTAKQALNLKLIDKIGYLEDAIELVKKKAGILEAKIIIYHRPPTYKSNIYSIKNLIGLEFMYLWLP